MPDPYGRIHSNQWKFHSYERYKISRQNVSFINFYAVIVTESKIGSFLRHHTMWIHWSYMYRVYMQFTLRVFSYFESPFCNWLNMTKRPWILLSLFHITFETVLFNAQAWNNGIILMKTILIDVISPISNDKLPLKSVRLFNEFMNSLFFLKVILAASM